MYSLYVLVVTMSMGFEGVSRALGAPAAGAHTHRAAPVSDAKYRLPLLSTPQIDATA